MPRAHWTFVESVRRQIPRNRDLREVPQAKRRPPAKTLTEYACENRQRNKAIVAADRIEITKGLGPGERGVTRGFLGLSSGKALCKD